MRTEDVERIVRERRVVVAFTNGAEDSVHHMGECEGYYSCPTVIINGDAWALHLTREATPEEAVAYWRHRAETAERVVAGNGGGDGG